MSTTKTRGVLFESLFLRKIFDSMNPSDSYPKTPTPGTPPLISTSSSSALTSEPASASHTTPFSTGRSGPPTGLSLHRCRTAFSSGASKRMSEKAASVTVTSETETESTWDHLMSLSRMTSFSDLVQVQFRRIWLLYGGFLNSFKKFVLNLLWCESFICPQ